MEEIPITSNLGVVAISITLESKITLCNLYIPNQTNFILVDILNIIIQLPHPFILLGDFNSHNGIWGSYKTYHRGVIIERFLEQDNNIVILNNNESTRINPINGNMSAIHLSFYTPNIAQRLHWKILPEIYNSDHFPIIIEILSNSPENNGIHTRWNLKNPDWSIFSSYLESELISNHPLNDHISIDETITKFTNSVVLSAEKTIGYSSSYSNKPRVHWWNEEIKQQIKKKNKALKAFSNSKSPEDFIKLKNLRAKTRHLVKIDKTTSCHNFTSNKGAEVNLHLM